MTAKEQAIKERAAHLIGKYETLALTVAMDIFDALPTKPKGEDDIYDIQDFWQDVVKELTK